MKTILSISCILTAAAFIHMAHAQSNETKEFYGADMARAALDYQSYCATCHGSKGRGDGPVAPALLVKPSDLTTLAARNEGIFPRDKVAFIIDGRGDILAHGPREMPVWGDFFGQDDQGRQTPGLARQRIMALTDYLGNIQR